MRVKRIRRKCGVRGCKNLDTYTISLTRESGNTVIMCKSCLENALKAIEDPQPEKDFRVSYYDAPPLFFSSAKAAAPVEPTVEEAVEPTVEAPTEFVCPFCGQVCKSEIGLQSHIKAKHKDEA